MLPTSLPPGFIEPCLPTAPDRCKSGTDWVHEIKHDGYRLIARRTDDRVRLYTCRGFNRADRYPRIVEALRSLPVRSITIDGEAVVCGRDGKSDFDKLHSGRTRLGRVLVRLRSDRAERRGPAAGAARTPQRPARKAARAQRRDTVLRASRRRRRDHLCARMSPRPRHVDVRLGLINCPYRQRRSFASPALNAPG
jgi:hypothetical protein